jgi:DNA-binding transcriptional LysR family regulator
MDLDDLRVFTTTARTRSLHAAGLELNQTASALSKAIRRLEASLNVPLFDRSAKQLVLNRAGDSLLPRALQLLSFAEQTRSELSGADARVHCRIAAPAMLLWRFGESFSRRLIANFPDSAITLKPMFEDQALAALASGEVDFACITAHAQHSNKHWQSHWQSDPLGAMTMHLSAGIKHPLGAKPGVATATTAELLQYDFACPPRSLLCGMERGAHSDGWRDDQLPRRIRYWVDDLQVLLALVKSGLALAYLPDFAEFDPQLKRILVSDCPYICTEQLYLVHAPTQASGWQRRWVSSVVTGNSPLAG